MIADRTKPPLTLMQYDELHLSSETEVRPTHNKKSEDRRAQTKQHLQGAMDIEKMTND